MDVNHLADIARALMASVPANEAAITRFEALPVREQAVVARVVSREVDPQLTQEWLLDFAVRAAAYMSAVADRRSPERAAHRDAASALEAALASQEPRPL